MGFLQYEVYRKANGLVVQLATSEVATVPSIIDDLEPLRGYGEGPVDKQLAIEENAGPRRLNFLLAKHRWDSSVASTVLEETLLATSEQVLVAREELAPSSSKLAEQCWTDLRSGIDSPDGDVKRAFRAAQLLAAWEPPDSPGQIDKWREFAAFIASQAVSECVTSPQQFDSILESVAPLKDILRPELEKVLGVEERDVTSELTFTVSLLSRLFAEDKAAKTNLVLNASPWQWKMFFTSPEELSLSVIEDVAFDDDLTSIVESRRRATALSIVLQVDPNDSRAWSQLEFKSIPNVRSNFIARLPKIGVPVEVVERRLRKETESGNSQRPDVVAALLQILGAYPAAEPGSDLLTRVLVEWNTNPDPEVHSSAEWLLRAWARDNRIENLFHGQLPTEMNPELIWRVTPKGHVMVRIDARGVYGIDRVFEIATKEISVQQHLERPGYRYYNRQHAPTEDCPCNVVHWPDALEYCNWLTGELGLPESELCYPTDSEVRKNWIPDEEHLSRAGFRLPRQQEWQLACRAGTKSSRFYGDDMRLGDFYVRHELNSLESNPAGHLISRSWPCGSLKPNRWGLFDMNGNVMEWCEDISGDQNEYRVLCGGSHSFTIVELHSDTIGILSPSDGFNTAGYRIVRTLKGDEAELPAIKVK
ncbi:MAG: SUMF1/EgtB/PvdO family nonheme iron enzyme [Planctomycetaceae bacterium]